MPTSFTGCSASISASALETAPPGCPGSRKLRLDVARELLTGDYLLPQPQDILLGSGCDEATAFAVEAAKSRARVAARTPKRLADEIEAGAELSHIGQPSRSIQCRTSADAVRIWSEVNVMPIMIWLP
jgi:hypothetical protein